MAVWSFLKFELATLGIKSGGFVLLIQGFQRFVLFHVGGQTLTGVYSSASERGATPVAVSFVAAQP